MAGGKLLLPRGAIEGGWKRLSYGREQKCLLSSTISFEVSTVFSYQKYWLFKDIQGYSRILILRALIYLLRGRVLFSSATKLAGILNSTLKCLSMDPYSDYFVRTRVKIARSGNIPNVIHDQSAVREFVRKYLVGVSIWHLYFGQTIRGFKQW